MARNYPKKNPWLRLYQELLIHNTSSNPPPSPCDCIEDWQRKNCWDRTLEWAAKNNARHFIDALTEQDFYATSPFWSCRTMPEDFSGKIGLLLQALSSQKSWNKPKQDMVRNLISELRAEGYISFAGHGPTYPISTIGSSFLCEVPKNKKGNLKPLRGKLVRVICTGSGRHTDRQYMVGPYKKRF